MPRPRGQQDSSVGGDTFPASFSLSGNSDGHPSMSHGRGWNQECAEGPGSGCGTAHGEPSGAPVTVRQRALPYHVGSTLIRPPGWEPGRATNKREPPYTPQPDRRRPNPGPGDSGRLAQRGAGRASRSRHRLQARLADRCARSLRARVLPAPGSGPAARRLRAGPAGGPADPDRWRRREWRAPSRPGIGARGLPLSACPSGVRATSWPSPRSKRTFGRTAGSGRVWGGGLRSGAESRSEDGRGPEESRARRQGGGVSPGSRCAGRGKGGGLESRRGLLGQRSYWGRDREGVVLWAGLLAWGRSLRREASRQGLVPAAAGHLEPGLGLPDGPRDSPAAASEAPFWPPARVCGTDPSRTALPGVWRGQPHAEEGAQEVQCG